MEVQEFDLVYEQDFDVDQCLEDANRLVYQSEVAFESLNRLMDTHSTLTQFIDENRDKERVSFESVIPYLLQSSFAGTDLIIGEVSMESVIDVVKAIGKAILDMIRTVFQFVVDAISNFDLVATWLLRNIKLLERKRLTSRGKTPSQPYVTLKSTYRFLRVGKIYADEPIRLHTELRRLKEVLGVISSEFVTGLARGASAVNSRGGNKTGSDLERALLDAVEDIGFSRLATHLKLQDIGSDRWGRSNVKGSAFLGGRSMFYLQGDLGEKGTRALRNHGLQFTDTFRNPIPVEESREFASLTTSDLSGIPDVLTDIVMTISKSGSGRVTTSIKQLRDGLDRYVSSRMNDAAISEEDMKYLRSVSNAFTSWSKNVVPPLYGTSIQVVRSVLNYAQASTKTYS